MSEMFDPQYEYESRGISPIARMRANILYKANSYIDMYFALQEYLEQDLGFEGKESMRHILTCEDKGILPPEHLYDEDPQLAEDWLRLSFYKTWMPLYQLTHTSDEFKEWAGHLVQIIAPPEKSVHTSDTCFSDPMYDRKALDEACGVSKICPIKVVTNDLLLNLPQTDMNGVDYVFDSEKAYRNTRILLSGVQKIGILTDVQKNALEEQYVTTYRERFPRPEASY